MLEITTKELPEILKYHIYNFHRIIISGPPGIGKSEITDQVVSLLNIEHPETEWTLIEERIYNRGKFGVGLPKVDGDTTVWTIVEWFAKIRDAQKAGKVPVLILEDLHLLPMSIQKLFYEYLEAYTLNYHVNKPHPIVCIGNFNIDSAESQPVQSPIMDRLHGFYSVVPDVKTFLKNVSLSDKVRAYMVIHAQNNPETYFYTVDPPTTSKFPSPRSWEYFDSVWPTHPMGAKCAISILGSEVGGHVLTVWKSLFTDYKKLLKPDGDDTIIPYITMLSYMLTEKNIVEVVEAVYKNYPSESLRCFIDSAFYLVDRFPFIRDIFSGELPFSEECSKAVQECCGSALDIRREMGNVE